MQGSDIYGWMEGKQSPSYLESTQDKKFIKIDENEFSFSQVIQPKERDLIKETKFELRKIKIILSTYKQETIYKDRLLKQYHMKAHAYDPSSNMLIILIKEKNQRGKT